MIEFRFVGKYMESMWVTFNHAVYIHPESDFQEHQFRFDGVVVENLSGFQELILLEILKEDMTGRITFENISDMSIVQRCMLEHWHEFISH